MWCSQNHETANLMLVEFNSVSAPNKFYGDFQPKSNVKFQAFYCQTERCNVISGAFARSYLYSSVVYELSFLLSYV